MPSARASGGLRWMLAAALALCAPATPSLAQDASVSLVRDTEIEQLFRDYANPIFKAAGLGQSRPEILLAKDDQFNAFVADPKRIVVTTRVLEQAETPGEIIGVLAHETGHIAGHHLMRMRDAIARAQIMSVLGVLAGVGAIAAGSATGNPEIAQGGAAVLSSGGSVATRSLLSYQRTEERSADAAALRYLEMTGQSPKGMLEVFRSMADQQLFSSKYADPYVLSHPVARDRLTSLEERAKASPYFDKAASPALQHRHDMARAKLIAFTKHPRNVLRQFPRSDQSLPARYARAIAAYRTGKPADAQREIDALIATDRSNPYFWELKGQALLEAGMPREAIDPLVTAVKLAAQPGLIRIMLGHAMVSTNDPAFLDVAVRELKRGLAEEPNAPLGYRALAIAHARRGEQGEADLAHARLQWMNGDLKEAKRYAERAQKKLKRGSPSWLQADDILTYKPPRWAER